MSDQGTGVPNVRVRAIHCTFMTVSASGVKTFLVPLTGGHRVQSTTLRQKHRFCHPYEVLKNIEHLNKINPKALSP